MDEGEWKRNIRHFFHCRKPSSSVSSCPSTPCWRGSKERRDEQTRATACCYTTATCHSGNHFCHKCQPVCTLSQHSWSFLQMVQLSPSLLLIVSREVRFVSPILFFPSCLALLVPSRLSGVRGALNACEEPACRAVCMLLLPSSWPEETELWLGTADVLHRAKAQSQMWDPPTSVRSFGCSADLIL